MNRPRREDECYRCYKRHLREEAKEFKNERWRQIWTSSIIMPDAKDDNPVRDLRRLVKMKVRGTYDRTAGDRIPNSLHEKRRRERILAKLKKRGILNETNLSGNSV